MSLFGENDRLLTSLEEGLIRRVYRTAKLPPLSRIRIRDGLSTIDTPFTTPGPGGSGLFLIMAGPRLYEGDLATDDPSTLVHEMTHVWQYDHGTLSELHAATAHVHYYLRNKTDRLYEYKLGDSWNDFGFEGQAQLVEDWYSIEKMDETTDRYVYVKNVLFYNDPDARSKELWEMRQIGDIPATEKTPTPDRQVARETVPFSDGYLLSVLEKPYQASDMAGLAARVKVLEGYFREMRRVKSNEAVILAGRLKTKPGDKLAQAFQYRLSTPTQFHLLHILQGLI